MVVQKTKGKTTSSATLLFPRRKVNGISPLGSSMGTRGCHPAAAGNLLCHLGKGVVIRRCITAAFEEEVEQSVPSRIWCRAAA